MNKSEKGRKGFAKVVEREVPNNKAFSTFIDKYRREKGLSIDYMCPAMGISRQSYSKALKGKSGFSDTQITAALKVLNVKMSVVVETIG